MSENYTMTDTPYTPKQGDEATREAVAKAIQASWPEIIKAWEAGTGDQHTLDNLDELDAMDMATAALTAMQPLIDAARAEGFAAGQAQSKVDIQRLKDAVMIIGSLPYAFDVRHPAHPHPLGLQSLYEMGVGDLFEDDAKRLNRIVKADWERVAGAKDASDAQ